jgi:hypothetical protein
MNIRILYLLSLLVLFSSCANMLAPTGGEKDEKPPTLLSSYPKNFQTNYQKKEIKLTFDEYFTLDNFKDEFMVSPDIPGGVQHQLKKKTLTLMWSDTLIENTTYTFFLGNTIKDVNEGNTLEAFSLSFSTGKDIDSAKLSGSIQKIIGEGTMEKTKVYLLDKPLITDAPFPPPPLYITQTNSKGDFFFQGIKEGDYYLYFHQDQNKNKKVDVDEYLGFHPLPIAVFNPPTPPMKGGIETDTIANSESPTENNSNTINELSPRGASDTIIDVGNSREHNSSFTAFPYTLPQNRFVKYIQSISRHHLQVVFQDHVYPFSPTPILYLSDTQSLKPPLHYITNDTLTLFSNGIDSFTAHIYHLDTHLLAVSDTIKRISKWQILHPYDINREDVNVIELYLNYPLDSIKNPVIKQEEDIEIQLDTVFVTNNVVRILCKDSLSENVINVVFNANSVFYQDTSNTAALRYIIPPISKKASPSSLVLELPFEGNELSPYPCLVELKSDVNTYRKMVLPPLHKIIFDPISEGSYVLTITQDLDGNGVWTNGSIEQLQQPEPIYRHPNTIEIKEGWDAELSIEINFERIFAPPNKP